MNGSRPSHPTPPFSLERPTQFDPDDRWDSSPLSGVIAFSRYREAIKEFTGHPAPRISRLDLVIVIACNAVAISCAFAPWVQYQTVHATIGQAPGTRVDGPLMIVISAIAILTFAIVSILEEAALMATIGFGANVISFFITGITWAFVDTIDIAEATSSIPLVAGWGVVAATFASLLAVIFAFRVMRIARIY